MVYSRKSAHCCLLFSFMIVHLTASFSVEELCARRCLYGRGGVLCNCNARHFTGKRSSFSQNPKIYTEDEKIHEHRSNFLQNRVIRDSLLVSDHSMNDGSLQQTEGISRKYNTEGVNRYLDDSWHHQNFEDISNVQQNINSNSMDASDGSAEDNDDITNMKTNDNDAFPALILQDDDNITKDDLSSAEPTTNDETAKVNHFASSPFIEKNQPSAPDNAIADLRDHNIDDVIHNSAELGDNLTELRRVLRRTFHRS